MHEHEAALIRAFIQAPRQPRWMERLSSPATRRRFLETLNDLRDLEWRRATAISRKVDLLALLRSHGAPETCYVVSADPEIDGRDLPLRDVLRHVSQSASGTLIGCVPGRLACFVGEEGTKDLFLLVRDDAP